MSFTTLSLMVTIVAFIHFVLVALHCLVATIIEREADAHYKQTDTDPLYIKGGPSHRERLSTAKLDLVITVPIMGFAILASTFWNLSQWATITLLLALTALCYMFSARSRKNIQLANETLERKKSILRTGIEGIQDAYSEPLIVSKDAETYQKDW